MSVFGKDFIVSAVLIKYTGSGGDVVIPEGITTVRRLAFSECSWLRSVTFPNSIEFIEPLSFRGFRNLEEINFPYTNFDVRFSVFEDTKWYEENSKQEFLVVGDGLLLNYNGVGGEVTIPDGVKVICDAAFYRCDTLTAVTIPNSVKLIKSEAFSWCSALKTVTLGDNVVSIESRAFADNHSLETVVLSKRLEFVEEYAFYRATALQSVTMRNGDAFLKANAFMKCPNVKYIYD